LADRPYLDGNRVVLNGGSHGGFLVLHLGARFGEEFRAVAARDCVTNLASKVGAADIPDWNFNEAGSDFTWTVPGQFEA